MRPLLYLAWRSLRGRAVGWVRLMKQPKYLVGTLAGVTWMGLFAVGPVLRVNRGADLEARVAELGDWLPALETGGALLVLTALSLWWAWPFGKAVVELTEAELHLLLPAPVRRRDIIQYAVLRSQWGILFGCLLISFFSSGGDPGAFGWRFLSVWLLLTLWNLHGRGRGLWLARLSELSPQAALRRRALVVAIVALVWLALLPQATAVVASLPNLGSDLAAGVQRLLSPERLAEEAPVLAALLTPARWVSRMVLSARAPGQTALDRFLVLLWPLALVVLHNEWVVRSQARFEEASLERSRRVAASQEAGARFRKTRQARRSATSFRLRARGWPEVAIVWKNLMLAHRVNLMAAAGVGAGLIGMAAILVAQVGVPDWTIAILAVGGGIGLLMTPLTAGHQWRNDLRTDLLRIEVIRTWPVAGWRLFAAEVAAPAIIATLYTLGAAGVLVVAGIAADHPSATGSVLVSPTAAGRLGATPVVLLLLGLAGAAPLLAAIATLSATLQNLLALLWPSWTQLGRRRSGSAAHIGQGLLTSLGLMVAMALGLLPGAVLVGVWLLLQLRVLGWPMLAWELPMLGLMAAAPLGVIVALLIRFGGVLWDRLDPSAELLSTGPR